MPDATDDQITRQAHIMLTAATSRARKRLGRAFDTMPDLRPGAIAVELLAIISEKDTDSATANTAKAIIAAAMELTAT